MHKSTALINNNSLLNLYIYFKGREKMWTTKKMKKFIYLILIIMPTLTHAQFNEQAQLANEYYLNGELDKAKYEYEKLATNSKNIPQIHNNYFNILISLEDYKAAEKYIKRVIKNFPNNVYYKIDRGLLFQNMGKPDEASSIYNAVVESSIENKYLVRSAAQYFINQQLTEYALKIYLQARKTNKDQSIYALELANTYRLLSKKPEMIEEYLRFAAIRPNNLRYVKNILQNLLQSTEDIENFKNVLYRKVQKFPNESIYSELLIWVSLQQNDFMGAFSQAKAIDNKNRLAGQRSMMIGRIALENKAYQDAIDIYQYVSDKYPQTNAYVIARRQIIKSREEMVKNTFPIEKSAIKALVRDYDQLITDIGVNEKTMEAYRSKALLHAFYLSEMDSAISILNEIINAPRGNQELKSKTKLDLGDIYLLTEEPWEATLLYSQVEKTNKDSPIGYTAKLKNARLNYFKGNFELAKSHLDILKLATTREISNDAISLSLLIQNNTVFDSSDFVMQEFADIDKKLFQNKKDTALIMFSDMIKKYPGHSLIDEIYLKMAQINRQLGNYENSLLQLGAIQSGYATDILGDDALFLMAEIQEQEVKNLPKAMELYRTFLTTYPGSVYVAEARKRFRILRGDAIN